MAEGSFPSWGPAWFADRGNASPALLRLAAALRTINTLLVTSELPEEMLETAAAEAEALHERLAATACPIDDPQARDFHARSPVVGTANVLAPPLRIVIEEDRVRGLATFGPAYEGPPGYVHGGFIAAAFDEVLGAAQALAERAGMTGTLTVRYRQPVPLDHEVQFEARIVRVEGRKILAAGMLHAGETLCAEAEALFIAVDFERLLAERYGRG